MEYPNKQPDVFISHATADKKAIAIPLTNALKNKGLVIFRDDISIPKGEPISENIKIAAKQVKVGVIILSSAYFGVDKYYTIWELGLLDHCELVYIFYNTKPIDIAQKMPFLGDINGFPVIDGKDLIPIVADVFEKFKNIDKKRFKEIELNHIRKTEESRKKFKKIAIISFFTSLAVVIAFLFILLNKDKTDITKLKQSESTIPIVINENDYSGPITSQTKEPIHKPELSSETSKKVINSRTSQKEKEDYGIYLNTSYVNSINDIDVSVTIIDNGTNNIDYTLSSEIANIYTNGGNKANTGLFKSTFIHRPKFQELIEGNSDILEKLKLDTYTDYLAIGKIVYSFHPGNLVNGTYICDVFLTMSIIPVSSNSKSQSNFISFNVKGIGNDVSELRAKDKALQNLVYNYDQEHSSLY